MIQHIVLFKLKPFQNESEKAAKLQEIKLALELLPEVISELKLLEVRINVNPSEEYDISLVTEFECMNDLKTYANHPEHLAVAAIIREVMERRACVDSVV